VLNEGKSACAHRGSGGWLWGLEGQEPSEFLKKSLHKKNHGGDGKPKKPAEAKDDRFGRKLTPLDWHGHGKGGSFQQKEKAPRVSGIKKSVRKEHLGGGGGATGRSARGVGWES